MVAGMAEGEGHPRLGTMILVRNSAEDFDTVVRGGLVDGKQVLPECGDLAIFVKPGGMRSGKACAVVTFGVVLPDGKLAQAQAVTSVACLESAMAILKGWREAGQFT